MNVSFYLKEQPKATEPQKAEGQSPINAQPCAIYARLCWQGYKMKFYISESIKPEFWSKEEQRAKKVRKFPEYPEFNARLDSIESAVKRIALRYANDNGNLYPTPTALKMLLKKALRRDKDKLSLLAYFADLIARSENGTRLTKKGKPIKTGTIKSYKTTKAIIEKYQASANRPVDFDSIDMAFYNDFTKYLTTRLKQSTNYIGKHIRVIKTVMNDATGAGVNDNVAYKGTAFTAISEDVDAVYLPEYELQQLAGLDLSDAPGLDRARDLFIVGCYTGLRFSDLSTLRPAQISGDMITITQTKTGGAVVIPVHNSVKMVMSKYGGHLPKALSNQKANDAIKDVAKKCKALEKMVSVSHTKGGELVTDTLPKSHFITTHTARRSFATNQYLNGVPVITIMAVTGHKTEKAFMKYIKVKPDEHAKILRDVWDKQAKTKPVTIAI
jgi:integrase